MFRLQYEESKRFHRERYWLDKIKGKVSLPKDPSSSQMMLKQDEFSVMTDHGLRRFQIFTAVKGLWEAEERSDLGTYVKVFWESGEVNWYAL